MVVVTASLAIFSPVTALLAIFDVETAPSIIFDVLTESEDNLLFVTALSAIFVFVTELLERLLDVTAPALFSIAPTFEAVNNTLPLLFGDTPATAETAPLMSPTPIVILAPLAVELLIDLPLIFKAECTAPISAADKVILLFKFLPLTVRPVGTAPTFAADKVILLAKLLPLIVLLTGTAPILSLA